MGVLYPMVVEEVRLKLGLVSTHTGQARTMSELKNAAKFGLYLHPSFIVHYYWKVQFKIIPQYLFKRLF